MAERVETSIAYQVRFLLPLLLAARAPDPPEVYQIDRAHTHIGVSARHLMVSNVKREFTDFSGTIALDEQDITRSRVEVVIQTASVSTNQERRDNHLRSPDFFDAARYPELRFVSRRVEQSAADWCWWGT